jgi:retinol dehydrogenase-12
MFAKELGKRLNGTGVTTYTMNPGPVNTAMTHGVSKQFFTDYPLKDYIYDVLMPWVSRTPVQGAQTILYCCLEESIKHKTGGYYCTLAEKRPSKYAMIETDQKKLWDLSEELTNCKNAEL